MDLLKGSSIVLEGSMNAYNQMCDYVKRNTPLDDEEYAAVCELMDVDSYINFWICEIFFGNTDYWNIKYYRDNSGGGKWRWVLYDLDWCLWPSTYYSYNMFVFALEEHGAGKLLNCLMTNSTFKQLFISRFEQYLDTVFETQRMLDIFDAMVTELEPEMDAHIDRWNDQGNEYKLTCPRSYESWQSYVRTLRSVIEDANAHTRSDMEKYF